MTWNYVFRLSCIFMFAWLRMISYTCMISKKKAWYSIYPFMISNQTKKKENIEKLENNSRYRCKLLNDYNITSSVQKLTSRHWCSLW